MLYIGLGDGGSGGDPYGTIGNGQNLQTLLGKMLRIDISGDTGAVRYRIPAGNPYAGNALCSTGSGAQNCPEIYAVGLRNPWRWSFDTGSNELWLGDVGQGAWEEINRIVAGGNYGWRCREGAHPFNLELRSGAEPDRSRRRVRPRARRFGHRRLRLPGQLPFPRSPVVTCSPTSSRGGSGTSPHTTQPTLQVSSGFDSGHVGRIVRRRVSTARCSSCTTAAHCTASSRERAVAAAPVARSRRSCPPPVA
jgi:hypothetical protein